MHPCPSCGNSLPDTSRFCGFCGASISLDTRSAVEEEEPAYFEDEPTFAEDELSFAEDEQTFAVMRRSDQVLDGRYELLEHIGEGGMGQVWRARDQWLEMDVAVKLLTRRFRTFSESQDRLRDEYKAMSLVTHPNIVRVFGYGWAEIPNVEGGGTTLTAYYTMQLIPSPRMTVEQLVELGSAPVPTALSIGCGLAEALIALDEQQIVHCDLKPANVFVIEKPTGQHALLADLGACRLPGQPPPALVAGTPVYMAPEQIDEVLQRGQVTISCAADIWAFGAVFFELLTGKQFFPIPPETSTLADAARVIRENMVLAYIERRIDKAPGVSPLLVALLKRCMRPMAQERIAAGEMHEVLLAQ